MLNAKVATPFQSYYFSELHGTHVRVPKCTWQLPERFNKRKQLQPGLCEWYANQKDDQHTQLPKKPQKSMLF